MNPTSFNVSSPCPVLLEIRKEQPKIQVVYSPEMQDSKGIAGAPSTTPPTQVSRLPSQHTASMRSAGDVRHYLEAHQLPQTCRRLGGSRRYTLNIDPGVEVIGNDYNIGVANFMTVKKQ